MAFTTRREREASELAELNDHWDTKLDLGGPLFIALEGKESKRLTLGSRYVNKLRESYGEKTIGVRPVVLKEQKDLDSFYQKAAARIAKGQPQMGLIIVEEIG